MNKNPAGLSVNLGKTMFNTGRHEGSFKSKFKNCVESRAPHADPVATLWLHPAAAAGAQRVEREG